MAGVKEEGAVPDFLRMDGAVGSDPANAEKTGSWHGWPTREITPIGVKSLITQPNDETDHLPPGVHMIRGTPGAAPARSTRSMSA